MTLLSTAKQKIWQALGHDRYLERYSPSHHWTTKAAHVGFEYCRDEIIPLIKGPYVVDLGCGEGWMTIEMAHLPGVVRIEAFDKADCMVYTHPKITFEQAVLPSALHLRSKADTVVSTEFIEHITNEDFIVLVERIKPFLGGHFIGSTPNRVTEGNSANPFHLHEFSHDELEALLAEHFHNVKTWIHHNILFFDVSDPIKPIT